MDWQDLTKKDTKMKPHIQQFSGFWPSLCLVAMLMPSAFLVGHVSAQEEAAAYQNGLKAERNLDLFGARDHFRVAIQNGGQRGWKEHVAWFMYINGFHNRECMRLFEEVLPQAADRNATARAIAHLKEVTGQNPPAPRPPVKRPITVSVTAELSRRLQYARELYWSGNASDAEGVIRGIIKQKPKEPALQWELSKVLLAMDRVDEAVATLHEALKARPDEPELMIDCATAEALRNKRSNANKVLGEGDFTDPAPAHKARARAHHYVGEFVPAAREYEKALTTAPNDELVAHGLTECRLRNNDIGGARDLMSAWAGQTKSLDWKDREELERELAASRVRTGFGYFHNSLDYDRWEVGADWRMRPLDELEGTLAITQGWFDQKGFSSIDRQTAHMYLRYQPDSYWAVFGDLGVNDYNNGWTSLVGGLGVMVRPISTLELSVAAEHSDIVDNEPSLGSPFYSMGTTLGGVGGEATMDALTMKASWTPVENTDIYLSYRFADLTDDNHFTEIYSSIAYTFRRMPLIKVGYAFSLMDAEDPAPIYTEGAASTPYYYDPNNRMMHHLYVEHMGRIADHWFYGTEARGICDQDGGFGTVLTAYVRYRWNDSHALRLDARYFTQNHGWDRNNNQSGHYDAINLIAIYEYRF